MARRQSNSWGVTLLIAFLVMGAVAGCRTDGGPIGISETPAGNLVSDDSPDDGLSPDGIRISLVAPVFSPPIGDSRLAFRVSDERDQPIDTAMLAIRGDMTHAGMLPIEASIDGGDEGIYRVPVNWTMAGDWIITVAAKLSDGRQASRSFDLVVGGEEEICTDGR